MQFKTPLKSVNLVFLVVFMTFLSTIQAQAEDDALEYQFKDTILVNVCIPANSKPPIQLYSLTTKKVLATFGTKTSWGGPAPRKKLEWCSDGILFSRYIAANFKGTHELAFYFPGTKKYYVATPSKLIEIKPFQGNPDDPYLDQPALNFFPYYPAQNALAYMNVNLGSSSSPESLRSVSDQIYSYLCLKYNTKITASDIDVLTSPGGWLNSLLRMQIIGGANSWTVLVRRLKVNAG